MNSRLKLFGEKKCSISSTRGIIGIDLGLVAPVEKIGYAHVDLDDARIMSQKALKSLNKFLVLPREVVRACSL